MALRRDDGVTMIEVTVSMVVMSVLMAMFTTTVVQVFRAANKTEAVATAQSQISIAFQRLDREIRYAEGVSEPTTSAPWYVEYVTAPLPTPSATTPPSVCNQLWLDTATGQLKYRSWDKGGSYPRIAGVPLASGITTTEDNAGNDIEPFILHGPDQVYNVQRLQVQLTATSGQGASGSEQNINVTFTAMNTTMTTSSATVCTEGRTIPW
jgi:prepilin-type N-terminal cleavage/methylation domain-containing protein